MPVLKSTEIGEAVLAALIDEGVLEDPSCSRRIRPDGRMDFGRQAAADLLKVFDHPRARPVQVRPVLKNDVHIRIPKHRLSADGLHMWGRKKACHDGVSDLVFDDVRWLSRPTRMHDHLHIRDVRQRIERNVTKRPDTGQRQHQNASKYEEAISSAKIDDSWRACHIPPSALTRNCFVAMVWPFCFTVTVTCQVPPDSSTPVPS